MIVLNVCGLYCCYLDVEHEKQHMLHGLVLGVLCWVGCPSFFSSFWKAGCRYWCPDGTGILYVLPVLTVRKTFNKFVKLRCVLT